MQIRFGDITVPAAKLDAVVSENMQKVRKVYKEKKSREKKRKPTTTKTCYIPLLTVGNLNRTLVQS